MNIYLIAPHSFSKISLNEENKKRLEQAGNFKMILHKGPIGQIEELKNDPEEKVLGINPDVNEWNLDVEAFDIIKNVKAVCTHSTSYDWVKPAELKNRNITVCNAPGFSADSVAEYAICMAIEGAHYLPMHLKNGWKFNPNVQAMLLRGKTLGIIGLGRIGKRIAEIGKGIGMKVIYWSRSSKDEQFTYVELNELFSTSDVVIPALVENEETHKIVTNDRIDSMKSTTILIGLNRIRELIDQKHVEKRLKENKLGGYIFEGDSAQEYTQYEGNLWAVPSIAWYTQESLSNLENIWIDNILAAANGTPQNIVNA